MLTLTTNRDNFEELKKNPLLFLVKKNKSTEGTWHSTTEIVWEPLDKKIEGTIPNYEIRVDKLNYLLVTVGNEVIKKDNDKTKDKDSIIFEIQITDSSINHWITIINSYIIRSKNPEDKYPYIYMLWFINHSLWDNKTLVKALQHYNINLQPFIFNILSKIGKCLSYSKQNSLAEVLNHFHYEYKIYFPQIISNALDKINPKINDYRNKNLFELVDYIIETKDTDFTGLNPTITREQDFTNPLLSLYYWFYNENYAFDYKTLKSLFSMVSLETQHLIVKRYFHDIRLGKTRLDNTLLEQFKDNKFSDFIRYRYCITSPDAPIDLSVSLLCDCLSTLKITDGKDFQTFDGVLDFAINHCDVTNPNINLGLEKFITTCNGGAVYNPKFVGFINYGIVYKLEDEKFNEENLLNEIYNILESKAKRTTKQDCSYDKTPQSKKHTISYDDKWDACSDDAQWFNLFLINPIMELLYPKSELIEFNQLSTKRFANNIRNIANSYKRDNDETFYIPASKLESFDANLLVKFSKPICYRISPLPKIRIGSQFDVFGIWDSIVSKYENSNYDLGDIFEKREARAVYDRVVESLKKELNVESFNGKYFDIPYDINQLQKLTRLYYKKPIPRELYLHHITFLQEKKNHYYQLCAPKQSEVRNKATNLPFFWCRGTECFKNSLDNQMLEKCNDWKDYSIYHLMEIMGYPKIYKVEGGVEPDTIIMRFIAIANKVIKKFNRLKCRHCGHLMKVAKDSSFNKYHYYSCYNPTCQEYQKSIYLNYCFKCKKGLIDSRDHVQCSNGWYICPECHSCCDDALYERIAQRYIVSKKQIPNKIASKLNRGHNDKGIYFCHQCGTQFKKIKERDEEFLWCAKCKTRYNINEI